MDPISNMIIILKNGSLAEKETVTFPYSKIKEAISQCLKKEGFIKEFTRKTKGGQSFIEAVLLYKEGKPRISEVVRVSKPSKRVYFGVKSIHSIRNGSGTIVLSTPKGILSGKDARKEQVGGEALFKIW